MPDPSSADSSASTHEQFVADIAEIDRAYTDGRLGEWVQEKLADERRNAGFDV